MTTETSRSSLTRVLIVDDDDDTLRSTAELMRRAGCEVWTAGNGITALTLAEETRLDLILLDLGMPRLDGYAVAHALHQLQDRIPFLVAISGYGQRKDVVRSAESRFDLHLVKPVEPQMLMHLPILLQEHGTLSSESHLASKKELAAVLDLLGEQLKMAEVSIDIAVENQEQDRKEQLLTRATRMCERTSRWAQSMPNAPDSLLSRIARLRQRISEYGQERDPPHKVNHSTFSGGK